MNEKDTMGVINPLLKPEEVDSSWVTMTTGSGMATIVEDENVTAAPPKKERKECVCECGTTFRTNFCPNCGKPHADLG
ncbi:MAG: hypothetical protein Q4E53_05005 [Eubacteriales bacterium]|nr:hypothetical protein [Eubacteriales bacterium]